MDTIQLENRREFCQRLAWAGTAWAVAGWPGLSSAAAAPKRWAIVAFSKPFQQLAPEATADLVAAVGWDGIECPVRKGGQVLPERVEEDLPRLLEALKQRGADIPIITTDVRNATDPVSVKVLRTAARLGIRHYRLAHLRYEASRPLADQLREHRAVLQELAALNRELGLCAGYQNHSGFDYVGGPVWDIHELVQGIDPRALGTHFDIGHATVEGGFAWKTHARRMEPYLGAVYVKDYTWKKTGAGWRVEWCPLGQGMVSRAFFDWLKQTKFSGPISQHHEYPLGDRPAMTETFKRDLTQLREWLG
jgi:sugar phosphate isomerase/epimerase